ARLQSVARRGRRARPRAHRPKSLLHRGGCPGAGRGREPRRDEGRVPAGQAGRRARRPAPVHAVLAARIDRLPEREKDILQTAAVIGKEFTERVLRAVSELPEADVGAALATLTQAEFIYEEPVHPEIEYSFKHPLTHEVAYRSQLGERRASTHAAAARAIAELYADKLDERAALLAHHWEAAGESLEAARWSRRAAEWAGVSDLAEAARQWRKVRELLTTVPESAERLEMGIQADIALLGLGWRLGIPED